MSSSTYNIKKLKITLEYKGNFLNLEVEPYRPIKYLKERASKVYYPLNYEIKLIFANKDLTSFENIPLGDFFKNKNTIHIKIIQIISLGGKDSRDSIISKEEKKFVKDQYSNLFQNVNANQNSADKNPNINNIINSSKEQPNFLNNNANYANIKAAYPDKYILCACNQDVISYYCRICNIFICKSCRMTSDHKMHLSVHIDVDNLEESIKLYAISLQADINLNLKSSKKYTKSFQSEKFIDPTSRKEIIIRKLDEIERKQEALLKNLPFISEEEINYTLQDFERVGYQAHYDVEQVLEKIYYSYSKRHRRITFEETEKFFNMINQKEKDIEKFNYNILAYKFNFQVHKKIDDMYKVIEKAIDAVLLSDVNQMNSGLDDSMVTLEMINMLKNNITKSESKIFNEENKLEKSNENNEIFSNNNSPVKDPKENNVNINKNRIFIEAIDKNENEEKKKISSSNNDYLGNINIKEPKVKIEKENVALKAEMNLNLSNEPTNIGNNNINNIKESKQNLPLDKNKNKDNITEVTESINKEENKKLEKLQNEKNKSNNSINQADLNQQHQKEKENEIPKNDKTNTSVNQADLNQHPQNENDSPKKDKTNTSVNQADLNKHLQNENEKENDIPKKDKSTTNTNQIKLENISNTNLNNISSGNIKIEEYKNNIEVVQDI